MRPAFAVFAAVLSVAISVARAQAPDVIVRVESGETLSGRVVGLYREGAMIEDADGRTALIRWEDMPSLEKPAVAAGPGPSSAGSASSSAPSQDACCAKTPLTPKPLKGKLALSGTVRSGNVDSVLGALHAEITKDCTDDRITAAIDALYGKTDEELTAASIGGKSRWDHFFNMNFYSYTSAEALYDDIQNLDLRAIVGVGAGDMLWKCTDDKSWAIEGGISALYEDFSTEDDPSLAPAARAATIYKNILFEDLKFEEHLEILVPLDDPAGYLARSKTILGMPLCKDLALRLSLEITYQGDPPPGTQALDILGLVGVEYQF